jgi:hypothetical protein
LAYPSTIPRVPVGNLAYPPGTPGTLLLAANTLYATPWDLGGLEQFWSEQIAARISTGAAGAGGGVWFGLADDAGGVPGPLLASFLVPGAGGGLLSPALPALMLPPLVWCLALSDTFATTQPTVSAIAAGGRSQTNAVVNNVPGAASLPTGATAVSIGFTVARAFSLGLPQDGRSLAWAAALNAAFPVVAARVAGYVTPRPNPELDVAGAVEAPVLTPGAVQIPSGTQQARTPSLTALPTGLPTTPGGMPT